MITKCWLRAILQASSVVNNLLYSGLSGILSKTFSVVALHPANNALLRCRGGLDVNIQFFLKKTAVLTYSNLAICKFLCWAHNYLL